jgi:hypothetical protein
MQKPTMTLTEALKLLKLEKNKVLSDSNQIKEYSAKLSTDTSPYPDPKAKVAEWVQSATDKIRFIEKLSEAIARTNLLTTVTIELEGKQITKSVAAWIVRRRELAALEATLYRSMTNKGLRAQLIAATVAGNPPTVVSVELAYDQNERDKKIDALSSEPTLIDSKLETVNATTLLIWE